MIVYDCEQGTDEWLQLRAGVITASNFGEIYRKTTRGANKGDWTTPAKHYAVRTAIERISGEPLSDKFQHSAMRRGNQLEETARLAYEAKTGNLVEITGFVTDDDEILGCSPDGLVSSPSKYEFGGGVEIKCLLDPGQIQKTILDGDYSDYMDQAHGGMLICHREWWDLAFYVPMLESVGTTLHVKRIERDYDYLVKLKVALVAFNGLIEIYEEKLRKVE